MLEVKEEKGVGTVLDAVLYDGVIKIGDTIVIGNPDEPIITKVKTILVPEKGKLKSVKEAEASAGIKIAANDIEQVIPGVPVEVAGANIEETKAKCRQR